MRYLLDSHSFLWLLQAPWKLSSRVSQIVADPASKLALSIATPWELAIKSGLGKLDVGEVLRRFEELIASGSFELVETKVSHVVGAGHLPQHHKDPFDRLLISQAAELRIPILSRDRVFDLYGVKRIWD
jgi:PIN domain nuclease of toxin-antitoxin system